MKGTGWAKDPDDPRDFTWRGYVALAEMPLPTSGKRWARGPVLDQGVTPQCVGYSSTTLKFHQEWMDHRRYYNFDSAELYRRCKALDGYPGDGTYIRIALDIMVKEGILARAAPRELAEDTYFKIGSYVRLQSLQEIKEAIYFTGPVIFGISVDDTIDEVDSDGNWKEPTGQIIGGHAMVIFGWSDRKRAFLIKNSWGTEWGKDGYAWLPYSHFEAYPDWDAWRTFDDPVGAVPRV